MMICPICNKTFVPRTKRQSVCGLACFVVMKKQKELVRNRPATGPYHNSINGQREGLKLTQNPRLAKAG